MQSTIFSWRHAVVLVVGLALAAVGLWRITEPERALTIRRSPASAASDVPITFIVHPDITRSQTVVPGVLIAHGFGSSRQIMLGYAYRLAYSGYAVGLWDAGGHGANPNPLDDSRDVLQQDVDRALEFLTTQPEVDAEKLAIVGHSMGSGTAMRAGIRLDDRFDAVVAISPTDAPVSDTTPANLQLQAGSWEGRFVANAERLLEAAGGEEESDGAIAAGRGRSLRIIPRVEHITILFSDASQAAVLSWLNRVFGAREAYAAYVDRRPLSFAVQFVGWMLAALALAPAIRSLSPQGAARGMGGMPAIRSRWWVVGMIAAPFVATGLLAGVSFLRPINEIGGMLVGGTLAVWFAVLGVLWLVVGFRPAPPRPRSVLLGVGLFAFLWVVVGLVGGQLAYRWLLIPFRLARWPIAALALLPWLLAAGFAQSGAGFRTRVGVYLGQTAAIVGALVVAGTAIEGLFIVVLLVPALPLAFAAMALAGGVVDDPWAYAVGNALFFAWLLVALFPLAG